MTALSLRPKTAQDNDEFLFKAAKQHIALEEALNTFFLLEENVHQTIWDQMGKLAVEAEDVKPSSPLGIVCKLALAVAKDYSEGEAVDSPNLYDRVHAKASLEAREYIRAM